MRSFLTLSCILFLISSSVAQRRYQLPRGVSKDQVSDQWVIVKLKDTNASTSFGDVRNEVVPLHKSLPEKHSILDGMCKIKLQKGEDPLELINWLLKSENVLYAEPLLNYQPLYLPSDPANATNQGYLNQISAPAAWDITRGDDDITIAIIDTGLDLDHEDLASSIWTNDDDPIDGLDNDGNGYIDDLYGYDFADGDNDPTSDGSSHGTRVGSLAGADTDNSVGISGVGFNTKIAALKGFRTVGTTSSNLFEAIIYAVDNGMQILNLSWGSLRDGLQSEQDIIDYAVLEKNAVVVAAAGNTDIDGKFHPASYNHVLSVGAVSASDNKWSSSTYNYSVDLMAPGVAIYSALKDDEYGVDNGTSYATPMVAGAAALVLAEFPDLNALQVMEQIRVSVDDIYDVGSNSMFDGKLGLGRLNTFNAVSKTNLKSLRAHDFTANTSLSASLFYGDTVTVTTNYTNFLSPLSDPLVSISSPDSTFTSLTNSLAIGSLSTLREGTLSFDIVLHENLEPNTPLAIRLDYSDGTYSDFQFLETFVAPDYFDTGDGLKMTVAGNGNLGFADASYEEGLGAEFDNSNILTHAGIMLATSETNATDNIVSGYSFGGREQDFTSHSNFKLLHHPAANQFGYSVFEDETNELLIEQSTFAYDNEDFLILRYRIINNSSSDLSDLSFGFFSDFDLNNSLANKARFNTSENYFLTTDAGETLFAATKILGTGTTGHSALDIQSENGNTADLNDVFSDLEKYDFLINQQIDSAGILGNGNDVATLNGLTFNQIPAFESEIVTVIVAAANSIENLENAFAVAENKLSDIIAKPRIIETILSCAGSSLSIDPESGKNFRFYQDASASIFLGEGTSFEAGMITTDTAFFIQNIDSAYASDVLQYQIKLVDNVADFTMSTDTLYLDHSTNVVTFTDASFQATSWLWDFGEGTTTSLQNPSLAFTTAGTYQVSLSVENEEGCSDTTIKTLVVAERPASPTFETFTVCPEGFVTIADEAADFLKVYDTNDASNPAHQGNDLMVGPITESTTVFVSGVYNQFESLRTPVTINLEDFSAGFAFEIDTTSTAHNVIARTSTMEGAFEWFLNDLSQGSEASITIPSSENSFVLRLDVDNGAGCIISETKDFLFSSSPIPSQSDLNVCANERAVITPENGSIFGFYHDESLTNLIKKGTELELDGETKIFVVGLDDGLPSVPIEVNISYEVFELEIISETAVISNKNRVTFTTSPAEGIKSFEWYVDGSLVEVSANPILFFENTEYEIVLAAVNNSGCEQSDTIQLDFTIIPVLGIENENYFSTYPNPSQGLITIKSKEKPTNLSVWDLTGKEQLTELVVGEKLNLSSLPSGIYLLKAQINGTIYQDRIVIDH